jgi:hypothetical protein
MSYEVRIYIAQSDAGHIYEGHYLLRLSISFILLTVIQDLRCMTPAAACIIIST